LKSVKSVVKNWNVKKLLEGSVYNYKKKAEYGNHTTDTVQTTLTVQKKNLSVLHLGYA